MTAEKPLKKFLRKFILLWISAAALSFLLLNGGTSGIALPAGGYLVAIVASLALLIFECGIITLVTAGLKSLASAPSIFVRGIGYLLLIVFGVLLTGYLFSIVISWNFFAHRLGFITLTAVISALADFVALLVYFTPRDIMLLSAGTLVAACIAAVIIVSVPAASGRELRRLCAMVIAAALSVVVLIRALPSAFDGTTTARLRNLFEAHSLPSVTLLWGPIVFYDPRPAQLTVKLEPQTDFMEWGKSLPVPAQPRKNILVFAIEAMRADEINLKVDGHEVTPNINRLAADGINFTRAFANGNESHYSMTSMVSGLFPMKFPQRDKFSKIDYPLTRIYDLLSFGYFTAFISSANERWQNMIAVTYTNNLTYFFHAETYKGAGLPVPASDSGLANALKNGKLKTGKLDDAITAEEVKYWITEAAKKGKERGKPTFTMVSLQTSHFPYEQAGKMPFPFEPHELTPAEEKSLSFFDYPKELAPKMRNRYRNSLSYVDAQIGSIVESLRAQDLLKDTIVIVFGDHGELFHENGAVTHAAKLFNNSLQVAFVVYGAPYPKGEYAAPISLVDLGPLLLELAQMPQYNGFQGRVPPGLKDLKPSEQETFYPTFSSVQNIAYEDSVVIGRWRYVGGRRGADERLFDLSADPLEKNNLVNSESASGVVRCLKETLNSFHENQIAYYSNDELKKKFFPPKHEMNPVWCERSIFHP